MSKILIVNLKRFGDIFASAHLVASLVKNNPDVKIEMLVYEEFKRATQGLKNVAKIHVIDRKKILSLSKNEIFSDGFAIEDLYNVLRPLREEGWDNVINYSNELVGSYLTSYISKKMHTGIKFSKHNTTTPSDEWAEVFNDVLTSFKNSPIHYVDCYQRMSGATSSCSSGKLKMNKKHTELAGRNLNMLRKNESVAGHEVKIVGLQLKASSISKEISYDVLVDLVNMILDDPGLHPILLISPTGEERKYSNEINKIFNNTLVTVEADFVAAPSVLQNLDLLVTPCTAVKHIADLVGTPVVEVSLGEAPLFKQGTCNTGNIVLSEKSSSRFGGKRGSLTSEFGPTAKDIIFAIGSILGTQADRSIALSKDIVMYRVNRDVLGITYEQCGGEFDSQFEIARYAARNYLIKHFNLDWEGRSHTAIMRAPVKDLQHWVNLEKLATTNVTRELLGTLRALLQTKENMKFGKEFACSLDKLLSRCEKGNVASIAVLIFRAKLEALTGDSLSENITQVEECLYQLKTNIQIALEVIKDLEDQCHHVRKDKKSKTEKRKPEVVVLNV